MEETKNRRKGKWKKLRTGEKESGRNLEQEKRKVEEIRNRRKGKEVEETKKRRVRTVEKEVEETKNRKGKSKVTTNLS